MPSALFHPKLPDSNHPRVERRADPRYIAEHFPLIQVLVKSTFQPFHAHVRDFSVTGLGIICFALGPLCCALGGQSMSHQRMLRLVSGTICLTMLCCAQG